MQYLKKKPYCFVTRTEALLEIKSEQIANRKIQKMVPIPKSVRKITGVRFDIFADVKNRRHYLRVARAYFSHDVCFVFSDVTNKTSQVVIYKENTQAGKFDYFSLYGKINKS